MPYRYSIDTDARLVMVVGEGTADLAATEALMRALSVDVATRPDFDALIDVRALDFMPTFREAQEIRAILQDVRDDYQGRIAVVVEGTVRFGVTRMVSQLIEASGIRMEAFHDMESARAWLAERS
jgi:hypothetical protein